MPRCAAAKEHALDAGPARQDPGDSRSRPGRSSCRAHRQRLRHAGAGLRRAPLSAAAAAGTERRDLDDLLAESDVVSIHAPLTPATRGLLDAQRLALMKRTAWLINTARGAIVDEAALVTRFRKGASPAPASMSSIRSRSLWSPAHPSSQRGPPAPHRLPHRRWLPSLRRRGVRVLLAYLDGREVEQFSA